MPQKAKSKVSFSNWVLGGPLVTVSKTDTVIHPTHRSRERRARRVVITEVDSVCFIYPF